MDIKEVQALAGAVTDLAAVPAKNGKGVMVGGWGLISYRGKVGYYDDDGIDDDGKNKAIVYFGEPLVDEYYMISHRSLKPATVEQIQEYQATH